MMNQGRVIRGRVKYRVEYQVHYRILGEFLSKKVKFLLKSGKKKLFIRSSGFGLMYPTHIKYFSNSEAGSSYLLKFRCRRLWLGFQYQASTRPAYQSFDNRLEDEPRVGTLIH